MHPGFPLFSVHVLHLPISTFAHLEIIRILDSPWCVCSSVSTTILIFLLQNLDKGKLFRMIFLPLNSVLMMKQSGRKGPQTSSIHQVASEKRIQITIIIFVDDKFRQITHFPICKWDHWEGRWQPSHRQRHNKELAKTYKSNQYEENLPKSKWGWWRWIQCTSFLNFWFPTGLAAQCSGDGVCFATCNPRWWRTCRWTPCIHWGLLPLQMLINRDDCDCDQQETRYKTFSPKPQSSGLGPQPFLLWEEWTIYGWL